MAGSTGGELRSLKVALGVYLAVFAGKLAIYFATGVLVLLAEALHSLTDILIAGFLLGAAVYARRASDADHMFGHGRAQNVGGLVAAVLFISFTAYKLYEESVPRLFTSEPVVYRNLWLAVGVLVASMVVVAVPGLSLLRQRPRGAAARALLLEIANDEAGLVAALVGAAFVVWGRSIADPISSIVVATIIAVNGLILLKDNASYLLGRSPSAGQLATIEKASRGVPGVLGVHDLRAELIGPGQVHAGMHVEVARGTSIEEATRIAKEIKTHVHDDSDAGYCVIELEAAGSHQ